jgi:hypothetical protein
MVVSRVHRLAGTAALVAAALAIGGCGAPKDGPGLLWTIPSRTIYSPIESVSPFTHLITPGLHTQLKVQAFNLARHDMVLDRIELVDAQGITQHDSWTLSPIALQMSSEWAEERDSWVHDPGTRKVAGTVIPAFDGSPAEASGHGSERAGAAGRHLNFLYLIVDVTVAGKVGDKVANRHAVTAAGFRVTGHIGSKKFTSILPLGFSGCFSLNFKPPLCPERTPQQVLTELGLPHGSTAGAAD